ncbi:prepilin-type N-terminal cleavage/methylation domain-containing protein, partial [Pseudoalteromonas sp. S2893]|uniref:prepilin-type N-terminal cleavage/methylation domain-containing protein n=1 Tax=Pseudoalteromonas sp. S2893 TaxID=579530 RepID=UPI0020163798
MRRLSTHTQAGYTLLELMASIAIVISVIKISLSVNHDFLAKNRADNHVSLIERNIIFVLLYS